MDLTLNEGTCVCLVWNAMPCLYYDYLKNRTLYEVCPGNLLLPGALFEEVCVFVSRLYRGPGGVRSLPEKFAHPEKATFALVILQDRIVLSFNILMRWGVKFALKLKSCNINMGITTSRKSNLIRDIMIIILRNAEIPICKQTLYHKIKFVVSYLNKSD